MRPDYSPLTVDLNRFPDLAVIYYGMPAVSLRGFFTALGLKRRIQTALKDKPEGLLHYDFLIYSLFPLHVGMRLYWKDFESAEGWARKNAEHLKWWKNFTNDSAGTGFWHETYCMRGGIEAVYNNVPRPTGLMNFSPIVPAKGKMKMAKSRLLAMQAVVSQANNKKSDQSPENEV